MLTANRKVRGWVLTTFGFAAYAALGFTDGSLGPSWPTMRAEFGLPVSGLGTLAAVLTMGFVAGALVGPRITVRLGMGRSMELATSLGVMALFGLVAAPTWPMVCLAWFFGGLGGGWLDTSVNAYFARYRSLRTMNLLHGLFGVGATLGPLVVVTVLPNWRWAFFGLAVAGLGLIVVAVAVAPSWKLSAPEVRSVGRPTRRSTLAAFFFYTGMEVAAGQWAFTLLFEERGMSAVAAGWWIGLFWAGLTVGRLGMGLFGKRLSVRMAIDISVGVIAVGALILWSDPAGAGAMGLPVLGLGMAAVFPGLVSLTPAQVGGDGTDVAVGYQLAAAGLGAAFLPWLVGVLAAHFTVEVLGPVLVASWAVLAYAWMRARTDQATP